MANLASIKTKAAQIISTISSNKWATRSGVSPTYTYTYSPEWYTIKTFLQTVMDQIDSYQNQFAGYMHTVDKDGYMDSPEVRQVVRQQSSEFVIQLNMTSYTSKVSSLSNIMGLSNSQEYFSTALTLMDALVSRVNTEDSALPQVTTTSSNFNPVFARINTAISNFRVEFDTKRNRQLKVCAIESEMYNIENKLGGFYGSTVQFVFSEDSNYNVVKESLKYMPYSAYRAKVDAWRGRLASAPDSEVSVVASTIMKEVKNYTDTTFNYSSYTVSELTKAGV